MDEQNPDGITAYHGSPHEFDQFDTSKIGTGEGAQAFGHGLYFAEAEPVAKEYRDALQNPTISVKGKEFPLASQAANEIYPYEDLSYPENINWSEVLYPIHHALTKMQNYDMGLDEAVDDMRSNYSHYKPEYVEKAEQLIRSVKPEIKNKGHMYEVHIDAHPDHFLDWDKPLSQQSEYVKNALANHTPLQKNRPYKPEDTGRDVYYKNTQGLGGKDIASNELMSLGIHGIRYLDAGSRGPLASWSTDKLTHNYVVFDHDRVNIKRRYAEGGEVEREAHSGGNRVINKASQNIKSSFKPKENLVKLYHGTTAEGLSGINLKNKITGPAYFSPRYSVAKDYSLNNSNEPHVIETMVPKNLLHVDFDLPGGRLLNVEDANEYTGNHGWTIDDYLSAGHSVGVPFDVPIKKFHGGEVEAYGDGGSTYEPHKRAEEQGYEIKGYHVTRGSSAGQISSAKRFDPARNMMNEPATFFWDNPKAANEWAHYAAGTPSFDPNEMLDRHVDRVERHETAVMPVRIKKGKHLVVNWDNTTGSPFYDNKRMASILNNARDQGYDTVRIKNMIETGPMSVEDFERGHATGEFPQAHDQIAVLNPAMIRSEFAQFDPERQHENDIGANAGGYIHKGEGGGVDRTKMSYKDVTQRVPELKEAALKLGTDEMTPEMYQDLVNKHKPVQAWDHVPAPATQEEIYNALDANKRRNVGKGHLIPEGYPVGLRLDIPAYTNHGVWVPTIHDRAGSKPTVLAHEPAAHITDAKFNILPNTTDVLKALKIAQGGTKNPFATINGSWNPTHPDDIYAMAQQYLNHPDWAQVGMDPERHSYFYDRRTQQPITHASEVLQVGPLVLAHKPVYGNKEDYPFKDGGEVERGHFGFGGDTEFSGSKPERGATGSAGSSGASNGSSNQQENTNTTSDQNGHDNSQQTQHSYRDMPPNLLQSQLNLNAKNFAVIDAMKEENAEDKQRKAEQMTAWANAGFPAGGPASMQVGEETRPTAYAMSDISKKSPVMQSQANIIASILPPTTPNVGMGMSGRIGPEPTIPNVGMGMLGRIGPEPTTPNVGMGMAGRIGPEPTIPNVGMGMLGRTGPEPTTANIAMGMPGRISPASTTPQQDTVVASSSPAANQQDALVLPGQKTFNRPSGVPMPPIPDRDLGAGNLLDTVLKPFGLDTASWLDNKSSEYIKQGMLPSDAYTKASYDLRDLQMSNKQNAGQGGKGRRLVKKLMPDGTYQDVWEEYAHGGVAKYRTPYHNPAIVEHALAKISAPPPALDPSAIMVAKRGRPF